MGKRVFGLAVPILLASWLPLQAGFFDTVVLNKKNQYEDESREHIFFNGKKALQPGVDIVGFTRLNDRSSPVPGQILGQTTYLLFAERITAVGAGGNPFRIDFGPIPAASPNSLQSLVGSILPAGTLPAGSVAVLVDRPQGGNFPVDYVNGPLGTISNIGGYLKSIASSGGWELTAGFTAGDNSYFTAFNNPPFLPSKTTAALINKTPEGIDIASFSSGLSVLMQNPSLDLTFANDVLGSDFLGHQLVVTRGAIGGGSDNGLYSKFGKAGVEDNATFVFHPLSTVPEPASVILFGIGLVGVMGMAWRSRRGSVGQA
jgi:hypothetical protein